MSPAPSTRASPHAAPIPTDAAPADRPPADAGPADPGAAVGFVGAAWRGLFMGAADVVPGVSGGTVALILGVYPRLLTALGALTRGPAWRALASGRWRLAWRSVDGTFLVGLVAGIGVAVVALAGVIEAALHDHRPLVYAAFVGLIAASAVAVGREVARWGVAERSALVATTIGAGVLVGLAPVATPDHPAFLALTGAIGICALVLPGVSGAFLLVLLGKYEAVIGAIARLDLAVLAPFALGAVVGLLAFARVLSGWLRRYPGPTHAALVGFLIGSLRRIWPWQGDDPVRLELLAPPGAAAAAVALGLAAGGALLVWVLTAIGARRRR